MGDGKLRKLLFFVGALALASLVFAFTGDYDFVRLDGVNTVNGNQFYVTFNVADTIEVDTFYSDTIEVGDYKWVDLIYNVNGYTLPDSSNDSVTIDVKAFGSYDGAGIVTLITDSLNATAGALDSTDEYLFILNVDSLGINRLYLQTVITDSFITDVAGVDTASFRIKCQVLQTGTK